MRIKSLLFGILTTMALAGCSSDDAVEKDAPEVNKGGKSYVAVNIVTSKAGSRAADDKTYENGVENENAVATARFYFFKDNGDAYMVNDYGNENCVGMDAQQLGQFNPSTNGNNVEQISKAVVVIKESEATPPVKMLVVLNAPESLKRNMSLSELQGEVGSYGYNTDNEKFVMSNSVYMNGVKEVITATALGPGAVQDTEGSDENKTGALGNPVDVYVERVLAKVSVSVTDDSYESNGFKIGEYEIDNEKKDIYARINGWTITNCASNTFLVKNIKEEWSDESLGFTWNDSPCFRSYWADTSNEKIKLDNPWKWSEVKNMVTGENNFDYCMENTNNKEYTRLLVAATLYDNDGEEMSLAEYFGVKYTVDGLKTVIANQLAQTIYIKGDDDKNPTSITKDYIDFEQENATAEEGRYWAKAILKKDFEENVSFVNAEGKNMAVDDVKKEIAKIQHVKIWNGGNTYYFTDIKHLGKEGKAGEYGIVRNHLYKIGISKISGLGTPVYDPNEIITPENPEGEKSYIAARINILAWRVVDNGNVELK